MIRISQFIQKKGRRKYRLYASHDYRTVPFSEAVSIHNRCAKAEERKGISKISGRDFVLFQSVHGKGERVMTRISDRPQPPAKKGGK
jgi:hypothetical protein